MEKYVWRQVSCSFGAVIKIQMPLICILKTFCSFSKSLDDLILKIVPSLRKKFGKLAKLICRRETLSCTAQSPHHSSVWEVFYAGVSDHEMISDACACALRGMFHGQQKSEEGLN